MLRVALLQTTATGADQEANRPKGDACCLRVVHVSTHVSLRRAIDLLTIPRVADTVLLADESLRRYGAADPRIAVAGLNPHASEDGLRR